VLNLRAAPLDDKPLAEALAGLARAFTSETGVRVSVDVRPDVDLPAGVENELYRIVQEALANVRRHAAAHLVRISLRQGSPRRNARGLRRRVRLAISDDGQGFDPHAVPDGRFGLRGMQERARLVGGRLVVRSTSGAGTRITVSVPVAASTPAGAST
jgi:signal transduction histidine kinase